MIKKRLYYSREIPRKKKVVTAFELSFSIRK